MFKIIEGGTKPHIKTEFSSSADLYARKNIDILMGETKVIPLGVIIDLENLETLFINDLDKRDTRAGLPLLSKTTKKELYHDFLLSHFFELKIRSSLAKHLIIPNGVGEIDIDYPDEIGLMVHNPINTSFLINLTAIQKDFISNPTDLNMQSKLLNIAVDNMISIKAGDRVGQIKLMKHKNHLMPDDYRSTEKRTGGFGSTNKSYNDHPESCQCDECQEWRQDYNKRNNTTY